MADHVVENEIIKADNGKELKFSDASTKLKSGVQIYTWRLEPQNVKLRYSCNFTHVHNTMVRPSFTSF